MMRRSFLRTAARTTLMAACLMTAGHVRAVIAMTVAEVLNLSGDWGFRLDPNDEGIRGKWWEARFSGKIRLPGSLAEGNHGDDVSVNTRWTGDIVDRSWYSDPKYEAYRQPGNVKIPFWLQVVKHYVGPAWYQREVAIPKQWKGKRVLLRLERCHWETRVWVGTEHAGIQNSLCVPHEYDLSAFLSPGKHRVTIRVDNRVKINVGPNSHSISDHTQTNWNGIVGDISLKVTDPVWIDDVQVFPDARKRAATLFIRVGNATGGSIEGRLSLHARSLNSETVHEPPTKTVRLRATEGGGTIEADYPMGEKALLWDEFSPNLYELTVSLQTDDGAYSHSRSVTFGMREIGVNGTQFTLNDRKTFLRGTLECCIFPLTGYPPTDVGSWLRIMGAIKAHGLNHIRFHSWCPPEAAFVAADLSGVLFHVEGPSWANQGAAIGDGGPLDDFLNAEYERILRAYGNHPSFCFMAYGNEPAGKRQREFLGKLVSGWKKKDPRRLYTSAAGWPLIPENDYHSSPDPRIQAWGAGLNSRINAKPPETMSDYRDFVSRHQVPVVSHEVGQWCVYPNFEEIGKCTGVLRARNFEIFRETLKANHMLDQSGDFLMASGKLQAICYKEEIESLLRTPGLGGFQILQLHDFPGQGTALVGVLDAFWHAKGYISAKEFQRFSCETVPLARMKKRTWTNDEIFAADIEVAHFGPAAIPEAEVIWSIRSNPEGEVASGVFPSQTIPIGNCTSLGRVATPLAGIREARQLKLRVEVAGTPFANDWDFWVYPAEIPATVPKGILIVDRLDEQVLAALKDGGKVLLMPGPARVKGDGRGRVQLGFSTIFWNTAWTGGQPPHTLGILCDPKHPAFAEFPTDPHTNWQWWELITNSQCMILDNFPPKLRPIVQVIDDWFTNRRLGLVFEARVGAGKILVCSIDLRGDLANRPVSRQLRRALLNYMESSNFSPKVSLEPDKLRDLLTEPPAIAALGGKIINVDSEAPGYEAVRAIDGDPTTIWHTPWEGQVPDFPHEIQIDLGRAVTITGFQYLPRQDMSNGRVAEFQLYISRNREDWGSPAAKGAFRNDSRGETVRFSQAHVGQFLRFVALREVNGKQFASVAELDILLEE